MVLDQSSFNNFDLRVRRLDRKHRAMGRGYSTKIRSDGLVVVEPRRARVRLPFAPILLAVAALILFKGLLLASVGGDAYQDQLAKLRSGSVFEKTGAWVMQVDSASAVVAEKIAPLLP